MGVSETATARGAEWCGIELRVGRALMAALEAADDAPDVRAARKVIVACTGWPRVKGDRRVRRIIMRRREAEAVAFVAPAAVKCIDERQEDS